MKLSSRKHEVLRIEKRQILQQLKNSFYGSEAKTKRAVFPDNVALKTTKLSTL